jgi:hypothetical protein
MDRKSSEFWAAGVDDGFDTPVEYGASVTAPILAACVEDYSRYLVNIVLAGIRRICRAYCS